MRKLLLTLIALIATACSMMATTTYYPTSQNKDTLSGWWANFSTESYTIQKGEQVKFRFRNYSSKLLNYHNWDLVAATNASRDLENAYKEYFVLRADNYGWGDCHVADNIRSAYNWDTFLDDMDGSLVEMTCSYKDGVFNMGAFITTTGGTIYPYA